MKIYNVEAKGNDMSFWNYFQSLQIQDTSQHASNANIKANRNVKDIRSLEGKIDALSLINHAMWELLEDRLDVTLKQLENKIEEIDLRDGKLDGKIATNITHCPDCGHKVNQRRLNCFWCGSEIERVRTTRSNQGQNTIDSNID